MLQQRGDALQQASIYLKTLIRRLFGCLISVFNVSVKYVKAIFKVLQSTPRYKGAILVVAALFIPLGVLFGALNSNSASAATSSTITFQGRLLSSTGTTVPDGSYNMQFNLYTVSSGGSTQWTDTRLVSATQGIVLKNGYFSVNLGDTSVGGTAFPSTINWDQEQWLGMTVRGSTSCVFGSCVPTDGEMTPRFKLTAVPYAFSAGQLQKTSGSFTSTVNLTTPTANRTILFPDAGGTAILQTSTFTTNGVIYANANSTAVSTAAGTTGQCLVATTGSAPTFGSCAGTGSGSTLQAAYGNGNTITTTDARNLSFTLANTTTDSNLVVTTATGSTGFSSFVRADGAGTADPAQLLLVDNLDVNRAQPIGIKVQSAAGAITTALDVSDAEIVTAIAIGVNDVTVNGATIAAAEFSLLDGKNAALVDINDAVATAITGTGTLTAGALGAGFTAVAVGQGGTGATTLTAGGILFGNGTSAITASAVLTNGQLLIGDGTGAPTVATLTQGSDITVTNGAGSITIAVNENPTFTTSVTTPSLTNTAALTINATSANLTLQTTTSGNVVINGAGTLDVQDNATFAGTNTFSATSDALIVSGAPVASATASAIRLGATIAGGNANGTYLGSNPAAFTGDFINLQVGGAVRLRVTNTGATTVGNTLTVTTGGASVTGGINNNTGGITNAGAVSGATSVTASGLIQGGTGAFTATGSLTLGTASSATGQILFRQSASANTVTLQAPVAAIGGNYTLSIPTIAANDTLCLSVLSNCTAVGAASGALTGTYPGPTLAGVTGTGAVPFQSATTGVLASDSANFFFDNANDRLGVGTATVGTNRLTVNNAATTDNIFVAQDNGTAVFTVGDGGNLLANNAATGTTGTTEAVARTNVTTVTTTAIVAGFANNDIIFINNAGQDYYTRIVSGAGTVSLVVSPAVSYDASVTITEYQRITNIGATSTDYTTQTNRFFQGYFLGGVVTGAGSTTLSDTSLMTSAGNPLFIKTNGENVRIRVESGGNVGIGTSGTPGSLLSVGGTTGNLTIDSAGAVVSASTIRSNTGFNFSGTAGLTQSCTGGQTSTNEVIQGGIVTSNTCSAAGTGTVTGSGAANRLAYWSSASALTSDANFVYSGGNLAIGTTSAATKLEVSGTAVNVGITVDAPTGYYAMQYFAENNVNKWHYEVAPTGSGGYFSLVESGVAERLRVATGGNLMLGTSTAYTNSKLTVWGGKLIVAGSVNSRLTLGNASDPASNVVWNIDNSSNTLRIFHEPNITSGGTVRLSVDTAGAFTLTGNLAVSGDFSVDSVTINGVSGRNYFKDSELSTGTGLRVGAAWGLYGIYAENGNVVIGGAGGSVNLQNGAATIASGSASFNGTGSFAGTVTIAGGSPLSFSNCGGPCTVTEGYGTTLNGDATHPVQVLGGALLVGIDSGGGSYTSGQAYIGGGDVWVYNGSAYTRIHHNASNGYIDTNAGDLYLRPAGTGVLNTKITYSERFIDTAQFTVSANHGTVCWTGIGGGFNWDDWGRCISLRAKKTNIEDLTLGLDTLRQLTPRQYNWRSDGRADFGFIAEEVEAINPILAEYGSEGELTGVHYLHMSAVVAQAAKELDVQVQLNDARLTVLEAGDFSGNLSVAGNAVITGTLTVIGNTQLVNLAVSGTTEVQTLKVNGKIITSGSAPTANVGTVSGLSAAVAVSGNDTAGNIAYTTGTVSLPSNPVSAGEQVSTTFASSYTAAPRIAVTAKNDKAASVRYYVETSTTGFVLKFIDAPDPSAQYIFDYIIIQ
jgi:hypothetical protein